jgi:protein archease
VVTRARDAASLAREIEHTADVGFEVEAPGLAELFERAGLAMLGVMVDLAGVAPRQRAGISVEAEGLDELLHDFLTQLLVRVESTGFVACELALDVVDRRRVRGEAVGERIDPARHRLYGQVKAVTYHQLAVAERDGGWWARVILDV